MKTLTHLALALTTVTTVAIVNPQTAQAAEVTYEFTISINTTDDRGPLDNPWTGEVFGGYLSYDDAAVIDNPRNDWSSAAITDFELVLPSGVVLDQSAFLGMRVGLSPEGEIVLGGSAQAPDPNYPALKSIQFYNHVGGFRYFDNINYSGGTFSNGYYGQVSYTLIVADSDGDGVNDDVDACPTEDASDQDADGDGCVDGIDTVFELVIDAGLSAGRETALLSTLDSAAAAVEAGNLNAAAGKLKAFVNKIEAMRGASLSDEEAELLVAAAETAAANL